MKNLNNARIAASNLYNASRELAMTAKQHELMGTSHDQLQQLILDAEAQESELTNAQKKIEVQHSLIHQLENKLAALSRRKGRAG